MIRLPDKQFFKNLYLDAVGEPQSSPRRSAVSGLQAAVSMNSGTPDQQIDLFLLDERFDRTPISCSTYAGCACNCCVHVPGLYLFHTVSGGWV